MQLGYSYAGTNHWSSSFSISDGDTVKKTFNMGNGDKSCKSSVGLLKYSGGSYQTPAAHC
ncbi:hypothetical protein J7E95_27670 [Streptomyces sp. ISL-14]|nr:hypothetical protein [Streptomyces sp. ISL-14]